MPEEYIWIITDTTPTGDRSSSGSSNPFDQPTQTPQGDRPGIPVPVAKLEKGMINFLDTMGRVLHQAQAKAKEIGGMELDEVSISVEVNSEGQLSLLGSGTKVGGSGALTLTFKRSGA